MRTTIKQQMKAVKRAMVQRVTQLKKWSIKDYYNDRQWNSLNDAYSSLASIALMESIKKSK